jgi:hypothetical protein
LHICLLFEFEFFELGRRLAVPEYGLATFREWAWVSDVVGTSGLGWALWGLSLCVSLSGFVSVCLCGCVWLCVSLHHCVSRSVSVFVRWS